jgi:hypothetical protein
MGRLKTVRKGYVRLLNHISNCLISDIPPDKSGIGIIFDARDEEPNFVKGFLTCGGTLEHALLSVLVAAKAEDEIHGDPVFTDDSDLGRNQNVTMTMNLGSLLGCSGSRKSPSICPGGDEETTSRTDRNRLASGVYG